MDSAVDLTPLDRSVSTEDLLKTTCRVLTVATNSEACMISRVLGDLLIEIAEWWNTGDSLHSGHGYLVTDYPVTAAVLDRMEPRMASLLEPDTDAREATVLEELGFDSVLMLSLEVEGESWALVEIYASGRAFREADVDVARPIVQRAGEILAERLRAK